MLRLPTPAPDTPTLEELREALRRARADTPARWGRMDCSQMLEHCRLFVELYLGRVPVSRPVRWLARAFGAYFLRRALVRSPRRTPRNLSTLRPLRVDAGEHPDFDRARDALLAVLDEVETLRTPYEHPLYGAMSGDGVVDLVRHHTAHHANQFGLLDGGTDSSASDLRT